MAIPILNHMDFQKSGEIRNVRLHNQAASGVTSPGTGQILYDSGTVKFYNGSAWVSFGTSNASGTVTSVTAGDGMTQSGDSTVNPTLDVVGGTGITANANDIAITAAQTGITSVFNTSLKVGYGNAHAHIDFGTDNEINFDIDGTAQIVLKDGALEPVTDDDVDLGSSSKQFKNLYIDGTAEVDALTIGGVASVPFESADHSKLDGIAAGAEVNVATNLGKTTAAGQITITSSTGSNVVVGEATGSIAGLMSTTHHDKLDGIEASADVTDTANVKSALNASLGGAATIGDGSDTITIPGSLTVTGTTTTNNVETVSTSNGVIFEGSAADANEITLLAGSVTADRTITLPDATGTVVLADATQTLSNKTIAASQVTEISNITAAEGAQLENINSVTISNTQWGYLGALDQTVITTADVAFNSLDIAGDADIDGTLETDALTINGTAIAEYVQDTVGAMFTGNTETRISATYQDSDGTIDLVVNDMTANDNTQLSTAAALIDVSAMAGNSTASFTHSLGSKNLIVQMYDTTSGLIVHADVDHTSNNAIAITFANTGTELVALGIGDIRVVVIDAKNGVSDSTVSYS